MTRTLRLSALALVALLVVARRKIPPLRCARCHRSRRPRPAPRPRPEDLQVGLVIDVGGRGDHSFNDSALRGLETVGRGQEVRGRRATRPPPPRSSSSPSPRTWPRSADHPAGHQPWSSRASRRRTTSPTCSCWWTRARSWPSAWASCWRTRWRRWPSEPGLASSCWWTARCWTRRASRTPCPTCAPSSSARRRAASWSGALAGLVTKTGKVGFVGGMEMPLIKRFEAGFRAGVKTTNPKAAGGLVAATPAASTTWRAGKQVAQDLLAKGADVIFHAGGRGRPGRHPGGEGGAARRARPCTSSAWTRTSRTWRPRRCSPPCSSTWTWRSTRPCGTWRRASSPRRPGAGAEGGRRGATPPVRVDFPGKAEALQKVEALRSAIIAGELKVPATLESSPPAKPRPDLLRHIQQALRRRRGAGRRVARHRARASCSRWWARTAPASPA